MLSKTCGLDCVPQAVSRDVLCSNRRLNLRQAGIQASKLPELADLLQKSNEDCAPAPLY